MKSKTGIPSFLADVRKLPEKGMAVRLEADNAALDAIADATGIAQVNRFGANLLLRRWRRDGVEITGRLEAEIQQPCVVTLEPVQQVIAEEFHRTFVPDNSPLARVETEGELVLDPEGDDIPDGFSGNSIDLWPPVIEELVLNADPFPRAPGASLEAVDDHTQPSSKEKISPFAVLDRLRKTPE